MMLIDLMVLVADLRDEGFRYKEIDEILDVPRYTSYKISKRRLFKNLGL